jgi:penicillin amidase
MSNTYSASERLVLSPGHPEDAIFDMPTGQSGHPLSSHYRDQQPYWRDGVATPWQSRAASSTVHFLPQTN